MRGPNFPKNRMRIENRPARHRQVPPSALITVCQHLPLLLYVFPLALSSLSVQDKHPHVPFSLQHSSCPLAAFLIFLFSILLPPAVKMRSTFDTNQPPLIITRATAQLNKCGGEERGKRKSLCSFNGVIKCLEAD